MPYCKDQRKCCGRVDIAWYWPYFISLKNRIPLAVHLWGMCADRFGFSSRTFLCIAGRSVRRTVFSYRTSYPNSHGAFDRGVQKMQYVSAFGIMWYCVRGYGPCYLTRATAGRNHVLAHIVRRPGVTTPSFARLVCS